jgi:ferredoxin--NADP+ reductase
LKEVGSLSFVPGALGFPASGGFGLSARTKRGVDEIRAAPLNIRTGSILLAGGFLTTAIAHLTLDLLPMLEATHVADGSRYNATVIYREMVNPHLMILRVKPDEDLFPFKPGQFAVLGLLGAEPRVPEACPEEAPVPPDKLIRRPYSMASSSLEPTYAEFYLTLVSSGELTPRLFALRPGQRLFLSRKACGLFTLDRARPDRAVLLVATGTGLAPYMSMLRTLLSRHTDRQFVVLHGARYSWDLGYRAELESLARLRPNLVYLPSITRTTEDPGFVGLTGRVQTLLQKGIVEQTTGLPLSPEHFEVFLCGNPGMIRETAELLVQRGFRPDQGKEIGNIHFEEYW